MNEAFSVPPETSGIVLWWRVYVTLDDIVVLDEESYDVRQIMSGERRENQRVRFLFGPGKTEETLNGLWVKARIEIGCSIDCDDGDDGFEEGIGVAATRVMHAIDHWGEAIDQAIQKYSTPSI